MGDLVIHPKCFRCDSCENIEFLSNEHQFINMEDNQIYRFCKFCAENIESDENDEENEEE